MKKIVLFSLITGSLLIITGIYSYVANELHPPTALIGPGVGACILLCYPAIKKEKRFGTITAFVLMLLFGLLSLQLFANSFDNPSLDEATKYRRVIIFGLCSFTCLLSSLLFARYFLRKKEPLS